MVLPLTPLLFAANPLKNYLFTKFVTSAARPYDKEDDLARRTLTLLLNPEVATFTYPYLMVIRERSISSTRFWKSLLRECPNLQEFNCYNGYAIHLDEHGLFFKSLIMMNHQLQVIRLIGFWCNDSNMCEMAKLPNLRYRKYVTLFSYLICL
jgi:hypothetical protein